MSYHFRSSREDRRNSQKLWNKLGIAFGFFIICITFLFLFPRFTGGVIGVIRYPFIKSEEIIVGSSRNFFSIFSSKISLSKENNALKEELLALKYRVADRDALALHNEELLKLEGRQPDKKYVVAVVLQKPPLSPYDTFLIDAGEKQGIKKGDQIEVGEGLVIGFVTDTFSTKSRATLYSSHGQKFQGLVGKNRVSVEIEGKGGGNFSIRLPRAVPISVKDIVVAPSITAKVFGEIATIGVTPNDSFQTLYFNTPVNLNQLHNVRVHLSNE